MNICEMPAVPLHSAFSNLHLKADGEPIRQYTVRAFCISRPQPLSDYSGARASIAA